MNSDEITKDLTEDLNEPLPDAPDTAPLLRELLGDFREERAENRAFRIEVLVRLGAIEKEQGLMRREFTKFLAVQSRFEARLEEFEDDVALLKAA